MPPPVPAEPAHDRPAAPPVPTSGMLSTQVMLIFKC